MEIQKSENEKFILKIYGTLVLIYAVFDIVVNILPQIVTIPKVPNTALMNYFFVLTGISLYLTPINILVGCGLVCKIEERTQRHLLSSAMILSMMIT